MTRRANLPPTAPRRALHVSPFGEVWPAGRLDELRTREDADRIGYQDGRDWTEARLAVFRSRAELLAFVRWSRDTGVVGGRGPWYALVS